MQDGWTSYAEESIDTDVRVVDAHHHLWSRPDYSLTELHRDMAAVGNVVGTVFVECNSNYYQDGPAKLAPVGETEWVLNQVTDDGVMAGMIGFTDMYLGADAGETLDAHIAAGKGRFKGIRHTVAWDKHADVPNGKRNAPQYALSDPTFRAGLNELDKRGLIFETWCFFHQLHEIAELAQALPNLRIMVDHLGGPAAIGAYQGPEARKEMLAEWRRGFTLVAAQPNVFVKMGGIGFPTFVDPALLDGPRDSETIAAHWRSEIDFLVETVGPERCMFESNFPPDQFLCDYVTIWNVFKRIARNYSPEVKAELFEGAARRCYTLPEL